MKHIPIQEPKVHVDNIRVMPKPYDHENEPAIVPGPEYVVEDTVGGETHVVDLPPVEAAPDERESIRTRIFNRLTEGAVSRPRLHRGVDGIRDIENHRREAQALGPVSDVNLRKYKD